MAAGWTVCTASSRGHDFAWRACASYVTTARPVDGHACPKQTGSFQAKNSPYPISVGCGARLVTSFVLFRRRSNLTFSTDPLAVWFSAFGHVSFTLLFVDLLRDGNGRFCDLTGTWFSVVGVEEMSRQATRKRGMRRIRIDGYPRRGGYRGQPKTSWGWGD